MSELLVYYIDDQAAKQAEHYRDRLARADEFECQLFSPPALEELDELVAEVPDLFLIDYELSLIQQDGTKSPYQGNTLAAAIRERLPDCPIVLITRETILEELDHQRRRQLVGRMQMYDELIHKEELDDNLDITRQELVSIAEGFSALTRIENKTWPSLVETMVANQDESNVLREASPPLDKAEWTVTDAAYWVRKTILEFPGILYDSLNAATRLGISEKSFLTEKVQNVMAPARYTGVFAPTSGRWWKGRLFDIAQDLAMQAEIRGPVIRTFIQTCKKILGIDLLPSVCVWDHQPVADWVCHVLQQPVKIKHSFRYYADNRPSVMDNARVSFRAIRESRQFYPELLDAEGLDRLEKIKELPEP